jgi:hypothetical protein
LKKIIIGFELLLWTNWLIIDKFERIMINVISKFIKLIKQ